MIWHRCGGPIPYARLSHVMILLLLRCFSIVQTLCRRLCALDGCRWRDICGNRCANHHQRGMINGIGVCGWCTRWISSSRCSRWYQTHLFSFNFICLLCVSWVFSVVACVGGCPEQSSNGKQTSCSTQRAALALNNFGMCLPVYPPQRFSILDRMSTIDFDICSPVWLFLV